MAIPEATATAGAVLGTDNHLPFAPLNAEQVVAFDAAWQVLHEAAVSQLVAAAQQAQAAENKVAAVLAAC